MRLVALAALVTFMACSHPAPDATPEAALRSWLDHMDAQATDPSEAKAAYALLGPASRRSLERRAERASQVEGHHVEPYEVLAEGRFALRFRPQHFATTVSDEHAIVDVTGTEPADRATIHCVKEGRGWRVELTLPEVAEPRRADELR